MIRTTYSLLIFFLLLSGCALLPDYSERTESFVVTDTAETKPGTMTRRMHNKLFTADNVTTILGGRNIGNAYFAANPTLKFIDLDVFAIGSVELYRNSELVYPATTLINESMSDKQVLTLQNKLHTFLKLHKASDYAQALQTSKPAKL